MKNLKYRTKYKIGQTQEYYNGEFYKFIYLSLTMIHHQSNLRGYNKKTKQEAFKVKGTFLLSNTFHLKFSSTF